MTNDDDTQLETIAQDPSVASLSLNDDANLDPDQDLSTIFDEQLSLDIVAGQSIVSRAKLIALQRKDRSLAKYFDLVESPDGNDENFFFVRNELLVRCARDRFRPASLEITQIVEPIVLRNKLLGLSHNLPSSPHLGVQTTKDRLCRHFF